MNRHKALEALPDYINMTLLALLSLAMLFPLYYVLVVSITDPAEYLRNRIVFYPQGVTLDNYRYLFASSLFPRSMGISAYLAAAGTALGLAVTSALAYALSRKRLAGRKLMLLLILFTILFQPGIIPNYLLIRELGLMNSLWSLILTALSSGWYVFLMKSFFDNIPDSLEEAAVIDGCNDMHVWWRIILPLSLPSLATFGLFFAVAHWNVFFNAVLYINDFQKWPLQLVLRQMLIESNTSSGGGAFEEVQFTNPESLKMAAVIISVVPIMTVYPFLQKHFARGVMVGSVKG